MGLTNLFDISLERANQFYAWGWRFSVVGAVITMLGIAALWLGTRVRDHDFESKISETTLSAEQLKKDNLTLQTNLEKERIARLQLEGKTEGFRLDIAKANQAAEEAKEKAEAERLARVKIEEKLAPRSITSGQIVGLSNKLKPYAGISIDILQFGDTPEITNFRSLLEKPLRTAGLRVLTSTALGSFIGLSVGVVEEANDSEKNAATAILAAFNTEGIVALNGGMSKREHWPGFVMAPTGETVNKAPIRIYVGSKP